MRANSLKGIIVTTDNPEFVEEDIRPAEDVFSLSNVNVRELWDFYREQQRCFSTAPVDVQGRCLRFFPAGYTIWSGEPGAGKTTLLRQLACHHLYQNTPVFVCSLEERPRDVFLRHCLCALGTDNPSMDALQWCADTWLETLKIWNYSARDSDAEHVKILAAIRVLARDFGVRHAIIDNLMSLDVSANDVEAQRRFSIKLTQTCELSGVHLHLVAHPRKRSRTDQAHTMEDVAGSADLSRKADNIVFVRRAKDENSVSSADVTPMMAEVMKQRWGTGWTGPLSGWYHRKLRQFQIDQFAELPTRYLCDEAYKARFAAEPLFS